MIYIPDLNKVEYKLDGTHFSLSCGFIVVAEPLHRFGNGLFDWGELEVGQVLPARVKYQGENILCFKY